MTNDKMPDEIYCKRLDESSLKGVIYLGVGGTEYIRADIHDRHVTELLEANNKLVEENRKLRNEAQEKWQPIETAPKAQRVLVWSGQEQYCAHWAKNPFTNDEAWIVAEWGDDGDQALVKPTHWMTLPEPPK